MNLTPEQQTQKAEFSAAFATAQTVSGFEVDTKKGLSFYTNFKGEKLAAKGCILNVDPVKLNPTMKSEKGIPVISSVECTWDMNGNCISSPIAPALGVSPGAFALIQPIA